MSNMRPWRLNRPVTINRGNPSLYGNSYLGIWGRGLESQSDVLFPTAVISISTAQSIFTHYFIVDMGACPPSYDGPWRSNTLGRETNVCLISPVILCPKGPSQHESGKYHVNIWLEGRNTSRWNAHRSDSQVD